MDSKARFRTIESYISREFLVSFGIAFLFFFFIFFINQLLLLARNILISTVSAADVIRIIVYSIPIILSFTFPFATLSGSAMTLGTLSGNREIIALRSSGVTYRRILKPLCIFAVVFSVFSFFINDVFLPLGTIEYRKLFRELLYKTPELELRPFSPAFLDTTMIISRKTGESQIEDIIIIETGTSLDNRTVMFAESGRFSQEGLFSFQFSQIEGLKGRGSDSFEFYEADEMELFFPIDTTTFSMISISPVEMSFLDVYHEVMQRRQSIEQTRSLDADRMEEIRNLLKDSELSRQRTSSLERELENLMNKSYVSRTLRFYEIELFRKIALPLGCLFLLFIAIPIAAMPLQHGRIIGFGAGVVFSTLYWALMFAGQSVGVRSSLPPFLLMFGPNILYAVLGITAFTLLKRR